MSELFVLRDPSWNTPEWFDEFIESMGGEFKFRGDGGFDHPRGYKNVAVLQPYHARGEALLELLSACKEHGLKVYISGRTNYYPGSTFTIVIYKPEDEQQMGEYAQAALSCHDIEVPTGV